MNVFKKIANIVFFKVIENGKEVKRAFVFYNDGTYEKASFDEGKKAVMALAKDKGFNSETGLQEIMNSKYVFVLDGNDLKNRFSSFIVNEKLNNESVNRTINKELDKKEAYVSAKETKFTKEEPKKVEKKAEVKEEVQEEAKDIPDYDVSIESSSITSTPKKKGKIRSFLDRVKDKIKKSPIGAKITALVVATAILLGLPGCAALKKHSKEGVMANSNLSAASDAIPTPYNNGDNTYSVSPSRELVYGNNDYYDDYTYAELLQVTTNASQKTAMSNLYNTMIQFNGAFADAHMEEGKSIRAALTFDEVIALQLAYNPYSKAQIRAIFNGADLDAAKLSRDYRNGTLQLMGAHVIETRENPVDMSGLLEDEESIQIYKKYHELFLAAKTATGEAKLAAIKAFYEQVRADFPLGVQERTEGISHSAVWDVEENRKLLPVTPMIAAAEIMFQNEKQKLDLGDQEIEFLNNLGLCNLADSAFERAQLIVLGSCEEDNTNPLYEQYRNAIIDELVRRGYYVVDDAHRDLSKLDAFQEAVNAHDHGRFAWIGGTYTTTDTWTETETWTVTETTTRVEEERIEAEIPEEERERIDQEIEDQNEQARREAEEAAERERQRLQEEADRRAEEINQEIEADEQDMQDRIDDANDQIDQNHDSDPSNDRPVNEDDFGDHNVHFDDDHQDGNGNLNDSVENITTDPTGDQTDQPLPDPNVTGAAFDAQADHQSAPAPAPAQPSEPAPSNPSTDGSGYTEGAGDGAYTEYPDGYVPYDGDGNPINSNEAAVDAYVAALADTRVNEAGRQYTYSI